MARACSNEQDEILETLLLKVLQDRAHVASYRINMDSQVRDDYFDPDRGRRRIGGLTSAVEVALEVRCLEWTSGENAAARLDALAIALVRRVLDQQNTPRFREQVAALLVAAGYVAPTPVAPISTSTWEPAGSKIDELRRLMAAPAAQRDVPEPPPYKEERPFVEFRYQGPQVDPKEVSPAPRRPVRPTVDAVLSYVDDQRVAELRGATAAIPTGKTSSVVSLGQNVGDLLASGGGGGVREIAPAEPADEAALRFSLIELDLVTERKP
jgi:hypothetical protein